MSKSIEQSFLPAVLEIEQSPPPVLARGIVWMVMLSLVTAVAWAYIGQVDIVVVGRGKVIPSGHVKPIQPAEGGVVKAVYVREGGSVVKGELLLELQDDQLLADKHRMEKEHQLTLDELVRQQAMLKWLQVNATVLLQRSEPDNRYGHAADGASLTANEQLIEAQKQELIDHLDTLNQGIMARQAEAGSAQRQVDKLASILPIMLQRAKRYRELAERKLLAEEQWLEVKQRRIEVQHDKAAYQQEVVEIEQRAKELSARKYHVISQLRSKLLQAYQQSRNRSQALQQELIKIRSRIEQRRLKAPVAGVVQQLRVHSPGSVVQQAQELMVLVPKDETLEVEAWIANKDIGFIREQQLATIKIDAFPYTRFGTIEGEVLDLSNDAVSDEQQGLIYRARVRLAKEDLMVKGKRVELSPGMSVSVEAKTGKRRVIEYFLSPLLRYADESIRER